MRLNFSDGAIAIRLLVCLCLSMFLVSLLLGQDFAAIVTLRPNEDLQSIVDSSPAGTTFDLDAGEYRMQSVRPKDGDRFDGKGRVVFNGSKVLHFVPDQGDGHLWVAEATANGASEGECQAANPLCGYSQDLFVDGVVWAPASTKADLKDGRWYFDRGHNRVYIASDPGDHTIELSTIQCAFYGDAKNVQIRHLIVERYATPAQKGAIGGDAAGLGWRISDVESSWNHGRGISLGPNSRIEHSRANHNGQLGMSLHGENSAALDNEIAWNNYAGFSTEWEAGGAKFWATQDLLVSGNYVHDNLGPGLWTDTDNVNTTYENNVVVDNLNSGISHEVSYKATIRNNILVGNGYGATAWLWNAQILVQNSSHVEVYGNTVIVPPSAGNGIAIVNQKRGTGAYGPWVATDNHVHDNQITYLGPHGLSGIADDTNVSAATSNRFDANRYYFSQRDQAHFAWFKEMTWEGMRASGQEAAGQCCDGEIPIRLEWEGRPIESRIGKGKK